MPPLIPIETLSFYLSKTGFLKFRQWFISFEALQPIHNELETLTYNIENSTWLEDKLRKDIISKIKLLIIKHIENIVGISPEIFFQNWIDSIQVYCHQGGIGHRIQYSGDVPHHWCVHNIYYDKVVNIPGNVILCGIVADKYINLSDIEEQMHWN